MPKILGPNPDIPGSVFVQTDDGRVIPVQEELANQLVLNQDSPGPSLTADDVMGETGAGLSEPSPAFGGEITQQTPEPQQPQDPTQQVPGFAGQAQELLQATQQPHAPAGGFDASAPVAQAPPPPPGQGPPAISNPAPEPEPQQPTVTREQAVQKMAQEMAQEEQADPQVAQMLGQTPTTPEETEARQRELSQQLGEPPESRPEQEKQKQEKAMKELLSPEELAELRRQQAARSLTPSAVETMRNRGVGIDQNGQRVSLKEGAQVYDSPAAAVGRPFAGMVPATRQVVSRGPIDPEVLGEILQTQEGIRDIMGEVARLRGEGLEQQAKLLEESVEQHQGFAEEFAANEEVRAQRQDQALEMAQSLLDQVRETEIDPNNFFSSRSEGARFGAAINVAAGQLAATITNAMAPGANATNTALSVINDAIERDFRAQQTNLDADLQGARLQQSLLGRLMAITNDQRQSELLFKSMMSELAAKKLEQSQILNQSDLARANGTLAMQQLKEQQLQWLLELQQNAAQITSVEKFVSGGGGGANRVPIQLPSPDGKGFVQKWVNRSDLDKLNRTEQDDLVEVTGEQLGRFVRFPKGKPRDFPSKMRTRLPASAAAFVNTLRNMDELISIVSDLGAETPVLNADNRARAEALRDQIMAQLNTAVGGDIETGGGVLRSGEVDNDTGIFARMVPEALHVFENWVGDPETQLKTTRRILLQTAKTNLASMPGQPEFVFGADASNTSRLRSQRLTQETE